MILMCQQARTLNLREVVYGLGCKKNGVVPRCPIPYVTSQDLERGHPVTKGSDR